MFAVPLGKRGGALQFLRDIPYFNMKRQIRQTVIEIPTGGRIYFPDAVPYCLISFFVDLTTTTHSHILHSLIHPSEQLSLTSGTFSYILNHQTLHSGTLDVTSHNHLRDPIPWIGGYTCLACELPSVDPVCRSLNCVAGLRTVCCFYFTVSVVSCCPSQPLLFGSHQQICLRRFVSWFQCGIVSLWVFGGAGGNNHQGCGCCGCVGIII